jgi:hypothetical protein
MTMDYRDRFDSLIRHWVVELWPSIDWRLIKA